MPSVVRIADRIVGMPNGEGGVTSADVVYDALRAEIRSGALHPNERLVEIDLVQRFDTSRFNVRTALVRLAQEGIVEHERNRGARVRLIDEDEAVEVYEVRARLEGLAVAKTAERATPDDVDELRAILERIEQRIDAGDLLAASDCNAELHAALLRMSQHETAIRLVGGLSTYLVRFQYRTILHPERPRHSLAEHRAIVDAVADGDSELAEQRMRAHLAAVTATLRRPIPDA